MGNESKSRIKEGIDELTNHIREYRNSEKFREMLDFVGKLHYLSPYNAFLVNLQKEGAQFVFSISQWKKYGRKPKLNGQQLITLIPFGPVQIMFEFADTEPIEGIRVRAMEQNELMEKYYNSSTRTQGEVNPKEWKHLKDNLPTYGISLHTDLNAAGTYFGNLRKREEDKVEVRVAYDNELKRYHTLRFNSKFALSLNKNHTDTVQFVTLCHELGHLFCRHLFYDDKQRRSNLTHTEREFEAETVAWLVCKRHGVTNPSEEYLATYAPNGEIPMCSIDCIMKAVTEIDKMMKGNIYAKGSLWYNNDGALKEDVERMLVSIKKERKERKGNNLK